jgi:hypothetical protein
MFPDTLEVSTNNFDLEDSDVVCYEYDWFPEYFEGKSRTIHTINSITRKIKPHKQYVLGGVVYSK